MHLLIIEDERKLVDILKKALVAERYTVDTAFDGEEGLSKALRNNYSVILLDIMLPKMNGFEVCRELRKRHIHSPIIMLTARVAIPDRVSGLDLGADDYLAKPFGIEELMARIRAVLRRRTTTESLILKADDLMIDTKKHEVSRSGKIISLTPKEYRLLDILLRNRGQAMTRRTILNAVWGPDFKETNYELNVHMRYLRRKIDTKPGKNLIHTVRGVGYTIKE